MPTIREFVTRGTRRRGAPGWWIPGAMAVALCAVAGCDDATPTAPDGALDSAVADRGGGPGPDAAVVKDLGAADSPTVDAPGVDAQPTPDASPTATSYLFWQSPGGFATTGPAVEVFGDGRIRFWKQHKGQVAHLTSGWDQQIQTSPGFVFGLFSLLDKVDFSKLPHAVGSQAECWPSLHWEKCPTCTPLKLIHNKVSGLKPEMDPVFQWFKTNLASKFEGDLPPDYCFGA